MAKKTYTQFYANGVDYGKSLGQKLRKKKKGAKQAILRAYDTARLYSKRVGTYTAQGKMITPQLACFYSGMADGIFESQKA